uniref:Solute carrier organic anion transporter family member n=1 Tax=Podarcis muralis TaxID=64176 RepID=A0A670KHS7_PODMU|nr:solute carrier organic anion transporter family member 1C1-like [Podarcis muralis]XP_028602933.1 solute carrier organic anion transporter family member 1C1-like [Podarcis muralis]XP_028602934.1 solute carrier organic anion transporter family member 1C1-like [Podarcis muralis]
MDGKMVLQQAKDNPPFLDKSHGSHLVKRACLPVSKLKIFLGALSFSFFSKAFTGSYMKSVMTQIERRFEIPSFVVGLIDGSFEIGNLLVLILVSYLGPKVHRPKVIAVGCLIMSMGSFVSIVPHFIMGRYNYKSIAVSVTNSSASVSACSTTIPPHHVIDDLESFQNASALGCEKSTSSYLWLFVLAGNILRGIGEAPVMPLGLSYIDDFATEQNSAFYIGIVRALGMFGPSAGFLLGSYCANLWVDIGLVDTDTLTINSKDVRWVGAWWLGILLCGAISIVASFPFWFLPYSLPKQGEESIIKKSGDVYGNSKDSCGKTESPKPPRLKISKETKDFFPTLKKLLGNTIFLVYLLLIVLLYNSVVGMITYEPKFMEQQFNIPVSNAIFYIGVLLLPATIVGLFLGGFIIKKFKMQVTTMAKFACVTFLITFLLNLLYFAFNCKDLQVAGLNINYSGIKEPSFSKEVSLAACNSDCSCDASHWDPVCGSNGVTYMSACLAGCKASVGSGKDMVFHNCSCVGVSGPGNLSAVLGQCPRDSCTKSFPYFLALTFLFAFGFSLGGTPTYMIMFRSVSPELKSLAVGFEAFCGRTLGGLPAPLYFGALIDTTCLKWGVKSCGESGSCRAYSTEMFRNVYVGFLLSIRGATCLLYIVLCVLIVKRFRRGGEEATATQNCELSAAKLPVPELNKGETSCVEASINGDTRL